MMVTEMTKEEMERRIINMEKLLGYMFCVIEDLGGNMRPAISDYIRAEGIKEGEDGRMMPEFLQKYPQ